MGRRRVPAPPPQAPAPRTLQILRFTVRQIEFVFRARRELGEVFRCAATATATSRSPATPTTSGRCSPPSPSRRRRSPASRRCGRSSGPTRCSPRSARATCASASCCCRRSTARPSQRYVEMIADAADREIDRWPVGAAVRAGAADAGDHARRDHGRDLRHRGQPERAPEHGLRRPSGLVLALSTRPEAQLGELINLGRDEPVGPRSAPCSPTSTARLRGDRRAPRGRRARGRHPVAAPRRRAPRTASRSPTRSCATSCSRSCSPGTRRRPTRWPGRSSACCAHRPPTTGCATTCARGRGRRRTSRRRSTRPCAPGR